LQAYYPRAQLHRRVQQAVRLVRVQRRAPRQLDHHCKRLHGTHRCWTVGYIL
jgi:hypothetical protein